MPVFNRMRRVKVLLPQGQVRHPAVVVAPTVQAEFRGSIVPEMAKQEVRDL